ncbi:hypothetical protein [Desulfofustis glycolicus]|uniref:Uncharacterized protein n=1 Tax=Desulfofustis glycolicus DSM 9705 TaxID=1121409 RepID=A0A1M5SGG0_9BACT|nr:hypothetical protein [Desulfofustis glycolicus]MCB2215823.1 hypothetical protein [Desulfobulbaceae bacterium]SHH37545.1 hypothetical protein SAMN02745124_00336 [Desulfofustis glycolicus DSM 9705]
MNTNINRIENEDKNEIKDRKQSDWSRTKCFVIILFSSVVVYKIAITPVEIVVDFPTLLSLLLAFFSVGLAALFYFKATESSNVFYDNTIKFTNEIASLLVKIESGFGEKLRHLDEGYTSMRDKMDGIPRNYEIEDTKTEIKKGQEELQKKLVEKDKLVEEYAAKAQLGEEEKKAFKDRLDKYMQEYNSAIKEISFLKNKLKHAEYLSSHSEIDLIENDLIEFIVTRLFSLISPALILEGSRAAINREFQQIKNRLPKSFVTSLQKHELLTPQGTISGKGALLLKQIAEDYSLSNQSFHRTR